MSYPTLVELMFNPMWKLAVATQSVESEAPYSIRLSYVYDTIRFSIAEHHQ